MTLAIKADNLREVSLAEVGDRFALVRCTSIAPINLLKLRSLFLLS